jgi:hypothetical protein
MPAWWALPLSPPTVIGRSLSESARGASPATRAVQVLAVVVVASGALAGPGADVAAARTVRPPVLGNWEGRGPHGLPLSVRFVRRHRRVDVRDLVIGYGLSCPANRSHTEAVDYAAGYIGPGSPSPFLKYFGLPANGFLIQLQGAANTATLEGRLTTRREGTVSMTAPTNSSAERRCWPRKVDRWRIRARRRRPVAEGTWTGTVSAADSPAITGTVTVGVTAGGRELSEFSISYRCGGARPGGSGISTKPAYEFIDAAGVFAGPPTHQSVNGVPTMWRGRFGADGVLRGTFSSWDGCMRAPGQTGVEFTAQRAGTD